VTWGRLLGNLRKDKLQALLAAVKQPGRTSAEVAELVVEAAAVESSLHVHATCAAPENVFCPFTLVRRGPDGCLTRTAAPMLHWGNVDSGSMVNIVYSGVLARHPIFYAFHQPYSHSVRGVGNSTVAIIGKLVGVPISLGRDQAAGSCLKVDFYVLDCPYYHFILGLALLQQVDGGVLCGCRRLDVQLGAQGGGGRYLIPLATRSEATRSPCYQSAPAHTPTPPPPPPPYLQPVAEGTAWT
jgi:hypothetical protein